MTNEVEAGRLVSELMANAVSVNEGKAIAELADARLFDSSTFRRRCVRLWPEPPHVIWRRVMEMRWGLPDGDPRIEPLDRSYTRALLGRKSPPETLEELQVAIDIDRPEGLVLAAWRDAYAADRRDPNPYHHHIDLCLDELRARFECWSCGRPAVTTTDDDLPVCAGCKEEA